MRKYKNIKKNTFHNHTCVLINSCESADGQKDGIIWRSIWKLKTQ